MKATIFQRNLLFKEEQNSYDLVNGFNDTDITLSETLIKIITKDGNTYQYELTFRERETYTFIDDFLNKIPVP